MSSFLINSKSENTSKSYFLSFKRWDNFIKRKGLCALHAQSIHVALYITYMLDSGDSCNTVNSAVYSTKWAHRLSNLTDPTDNSFVTFLQEAEKRIACPKKSKKDPVTTEMFIIDLCTKFKDCKDLVIIKDLAVICYPLQVF